MSKFARGSEWRRWDLHVHTPASIVQDYGGNTDAAWDAFFRALRILPDEVAVVGITDYFFVDGYERILKHRDDLPGRTFFPNIEFRLNTFAGTARNNVRHNLHVIFDSTVSVEDIRGQFLNGLHASYAIEPDDEWNYVPTPKTLEELGRRVKRAAPEANSVHAKTDLMVGFLSITYDHEQILDALTKSPFAGKYLIGLGYSEWDQGRWDQAAAEKRSLINRAAFALTSNDDVAQIAAHTKKLADDKLNDLVLHASDAHAVERIGKTKLWIKADPTFAGLKQVVNEHDRAFVGDAPPDLKPPQHVIRKISIPDSRGWFAHGFEQEFNSGLVTIVGGRGSGKSALAEMLACGAGCRDRSRESFSMKAARHDDSISGVALELSWSDGNTTHGVVGEDGPDELVKYLPQQLVEQLCSPDNNAQLTEQIESVIFQALDETEQAGASSFRELLGNILEGSELEKQQIVSAIRDCNRQVTAMTATIDGRRAKQADLTKKTQELESLRKSLPKLAADEQRNQDEIAKLHVAKKTFEEAIVARRKLLDRLASLEIKVKLFSASAHETKQELLQSAREVGVADLTPFDWLIDFPRMQRTLEDRKRALEAELLTLRNGEKTEVYSLLGEAPGEQPYDNYTTLVAQITEISSRTRIFETQKQAYQQHQSRIIACEQAIRALTVELDRIRTVVIPECGTLQRRRLEHYCAYFEVLAREKVQIERLYEPLRKKLAHGSETDRRLAFEAKFVHNRKAHRDGGLSIIDRVRRGNFREVAELDAALDHLWMRYLRGGLDPKTIRDALKEFHDRWLTVDGSAEPLEIAKQLKDDFTVEHFYNWLLNPAYFGVESSLVFDGTDLYLLSPGQKGIVLLLLYLGLDDGDQRPLIIDQPEENLDNLSVYRDVVRLFRERRNQRQIIMVTHNPNLVVNTDAEQVIVASYDGKAKPRMTYSSGSLEDQGSTLPEAEGQVLLDGILERVCDLLEGGPRAFQERSRKYALSARLTP